MKLLLLLAFVASAYSAYFEPGARQRRTTWEPNLAILYGEPHMYSFDGRWSAYQGHCTYTILRDNCVNGFPNSLPTFTVYADYFLRSPDDSGTYVRQIYVYISGKVITMDFNGDVFVDGTQIFSFPYYGVPEVVMQNRNELVANHGLNVSTKYAPGRGMNTYMRLTDDFSGDVCGLAGNMNDDPSDDWVIGPHCPCIVDHTPGDITADELLFGESWTTLDFPDPDPGCDPSLCQSSNPPPHPCTTPAMRANAENTCDILRNVNNIYWRCLLVLSSSTIQSFFEACVFDVCATGGSWILNLHMNALAYYCQIKHGIIPDGSTVGDMTCTLEQGVLLNTFDGLNLEITKEQKTNVATYDPSPNHNCRFQIRAVTTFDCDWDPPQLLPLFLDWFGVNFDIKTTKIFGRRGLVLSQQTDSIRVRGQNIDETVTVFPHSVVLSDGSSVVIDLSDVNGQPEFRVRSSVACEWGVNWRPNVRESEADIMIGGQYAGLMAGMCGDADGNAARDWQTCQGVPVTPGPDGTEEITDSCLEGKNQGQGIDGCTKTK